MTTACSQASIAGARGNFPAGAAEANGPLDTDDPLEVFHEQEQVHRIGR